MSTRRATIIVQPGTGWAVRLAADPQTVTRQGTFLALIVILLFVGGVALLAVGTPLVKGLGVLLALSGLTWVGAAVRLARRRTVAPGDWRYQGINIAGDGRALLTEAVMRATEVEHLIAALPTNLEWKRFRPQVEGVLWNAAGHAAEATKLDAQLEAGDPADDADLLEERRRHLIVVAQARDEVVELLAVARQAAADMNPPTDITPRERPAPRARRSRPPSGRRRAD